MTLFVKRFFPYFGFTTTAIAFYVASQQVILTQVLIAFVFSIAVLALALNKYRLKFLPSFFWFYIATIPGTFFYIIYANDFYTPLRQYISIYMGLVAIWYYFFLNNYSPEAIFKPYIRIALIAAIFGIFQEIFYLLNLPLLYDSRWFFIGAAEYTSDGIFLRTPSIFTEPSYYGIFLIPAVYFSFLSLAGKSTAINFKYSIIFLTAISFTFSSLTYVSVCIVGITAFRPDLSKLKVDLRSLLLIIILASIMVYALTSIPAISSRILGVPLAISGEFTGEENVSLLVNGINLKITIEGFLSNPIFGNDLGTYRVLADDILYDTFSSNELVYNRLMTMEDNLSLSDGGMMYYRLPLEIGIFGCAVFFWVLFFNITKPTLDLHRHIGIASLLFVICYGLRSGQIFRFELLFFLSLYLLIFSNFYKKFFKY